MDEWMDRKNDDGQMNKQMDGWIGGMIMDKQMEGKTVGLMGGWKDEWMDR